MNANTKTIIDLVNKLKYEVTEEQMAELSGCATPLTQAEFCDWHAKIDDLDLSRSSTGERSWLSGSQIAQLRELLHRIVNMTTKIGGRAVNVGKRVLKWLFALIERYPSTVAATIVMSALAFVVAHIPVLRYVLLPIVQVVAVGLVGFIFLSEGIQKVKFETNDNH